MNTRYMLAALTISLASSVTVSGCSPAQSLCQTVCDCQHCGDLREDLTCFEAEAQEAVSDAYECTDQWEAFVTCFQDKGTCDEKNSRYSTAANGTCSDTQDLGLGCTTDADCQIGFPGTVTCSAGACVGKACTGSSNPCSTNDDCIGAGDDLCSSEKDAVQKCIDAASGGVTPKAF